MKHDKICLIKTAWSADYQGAPVYGRHSYTKADFDGGERFNFLPGPDGRYYAQFPSSAPRLPAPADRSGWTVIFLAAEAQDMGRKMLPVKVVGWFENAVFVEREERPEYRFQEISFEPRNDEANPAYCFDLVAPRAYLIPEAERDHQLPTKYRKHIQSSPFYILRGPGAGQEEWRDGLASFVDENINFWDAEAASQAESSSATYLSTALHRAKVEKLAEDLALEYYGEEYAIKNVTAENRGYDFFLTHRETGSEIHLEIKGTASRERRFFLSRNEKRYAENNSSFRLFLATNVLAAREEVTVAEYSYEDLVRTFDFEPMSFAARLKD